MANAKQMVEEHVYYQQQGIVEDRLDAGIMMLEEIDGYRRQLPEDEWPGILDDEYRDYLREQREDGYGGSFADYIEEIGAEDATYEEREWLQIWLVSTELAFRLIHNGEMVATQSDGCWWFRSTSGGAIWQDEVMQEIASKWPKYAKPPVWLTQEQADSLASLLVDFAEEVNYQLNEVPFPHDAEGRKAWQELGDYIAAAGIFLDAAIVRSKGEDV